MKKQERMENKKRKIVALANIIEINENDKKKGSKKADKAETLSNGKVLTASDTVSSFDFTKLSS